MCAEGISALEGPGNHQRPNGRLGASGNTVTTYNPDGTQTTPTISAGLNDPIDLLVDATGKIDVLNAGHPVSVTGVAVH